MKFATLASGSSGNCTFVSDGATRVLIDNGLGLKDLRARLEVIGERLEKIDAILISHAHIDHVKGLPLLVNRHEFPAVIYGTSLTLENIKWNGRGIPDRMERIEAGNTFQIGKMEITPITVPHDCYDPVCYVVRAAGLRCAVVTDLGYLPPLALALLPSCDVLGLEFNHCPSILRVGPYPWTVKSRILSRNGHLSNESALDYIVKHMGSRTQALFCLHLSDTNNRPELVRMLAEEALANRGISPQLVIAEQDRTSRIIQL